MTMPEGFQFSDWCRKCQAYVPHTLHRLMIRDEAFGICDTCGSRA
jgi:hypothetical protein